MSTLHIKSDEYELSMEKLYTDYYLNQSGSGLSHIGTLYVSPRVIQQGRGIGSFFAGLYKNLKPLFLSGLNAIKNQALESGRGIISDFGHKPLHNILEEQSKMALHNLSDKAVKKISRKFQGGSGKKNIKHRASKKSNHSKKSSKKKRIAKITKYMRKRNKRKISKDIFSK